MANGKPTPNPYSAHDIAGAKAIIETGLDTLELIAKCQRCGNDFNSAIPNVKAMMDYAQGVLNEFASGIDPNA
jgi:hypothetical protein